MTNNIYPLVSVPNYCFFKTIDHNNKNLFDLRKKAKPVEGYFIIRNAGQANFKDTFQVSGAGLLGYWFLGRISLNNNPLSINKYRVDVYSRNRVPSANGYVLCQYFKNEEDLTKAIRKMNDEGMKVEHPSDWSVDVSDVFVKVGFDSF